MPISNFPGGFTEGISIRGMPLTLTYPGQVFWVGNSTVLSPYCRTGADGGDGTYNAPFATLDYAIGRCTASRGDIIMVKPGHAETISTATALAIDVAGIAIIGLGLGSLRPTFTFSTATATIAVSAANVYLRNLLFVANFADIASVFTLTTAKDFQVERCEFRDTSSILNFLTVVTTGATANAADGLVFSFNRVFSLGTTANSTTIVLGGNLDRFEMNDNFYTGGVVNNTAALLAHTSKVVTNLLMERNRVFRLVTDTATGGLFITTTSTTNTGMVSDNYARHADVAAAILVTAGSIYGMTNNLVNGDADASGYVLPAIGAN